MAPVTVLIIGCGVAGPVLAVLLKRKGYTPIVFEKVKQLGDVGASLMLMPNGLKVLNLVDITAEIEKEALPLQGFLDCSSDGEVLGFSEEPKSFKEKYGQHAMGVKRTGLNLKLKDMLIDMGIDLREGWELEDIEENEDAVTAHFKGGRSVTGTFLIGCDGIKAASRRILLKNKGTGEGLPLFSGLTQTAGLSSTPQAMKGKAYMQNFYGEGVHMITYPVSPDVTSWALTLPEETGSEASWGLITADEMDERKQKLLAHLELWHDQSPAALIQSAARMIKFGLFDRDEMRPDQWHTKRSVCVGDAAHPTSPHLGQGANQALEDCYHLSHALPELVPDEDDNQRVLDELNENLPAIFEAYAEKRQPLTSALVKGARTQGQMRVVTAGPQACKERNKKVAAAWRDTAAVAAKYEALCREPFQQQAA
ncbi:FAD binding domain-containing protein [Cladophialophora immunda]|nr:FAD binding domain-containing protein [Cladophialophora immunda]